ncbi:MAG: hypothetical protein CVT62_05120 [Actinobacteria bacterium HGW-Actinobacteria-2]|nr:MAG: hypothetical protein CVT62_05120 [Actinobacteria bacterium HGW-Actinobacteria-2]
MATHDDSSRAEAPEGDTPPADTVWRSETSRYFRRPGGWWWAALLGVPLTLALVSAGLAAPAAPLIAPPTTSATPVASPPGAPPATPGPSVTPDTVPSPTPSTPAPAATPPESATSTTPASPPPPCDTVAAKVKKVAGTGQIRFGYKSQKPTKKGLAAIAAAATLLKACPTVAVTIRGFADLTGPAKVNKKISVKRASTVRSRLRALGVTNALTVTGLGDKHSVAKNSSAKGRAANRRAEIVIP